MSQPTDGGFRSRDGGMSRVSALAEKARYAVITEESLEEIFDQKMLHAALYTQVDDVEMAFTSYMILSTLTAIRDELQRRIA